MPKKHRNLIARIASPENIRQAYEKTARGKKQTYGYLEFKEYAEVNLLAVREELLDSAYKIGPYRQFTVYEPKARLISALEFKDRLVQHAVCNVIAPVFERALLPQTFACRTGLGTHAGVRYIQSKLRSEAPTHFLKTDYSKFFPSIDRAVLHEMISRKIGCEATLQVLRQIVPPSGKGLPIGSLTSQLFANVYAGAADRFIHFDLGHRTWARYMDDIVVLGHDPHELIESFHRLNAFSQAELDLRIGKWHSAPISKGINFLGYRIWPEHKLLRKDSVTRAKRKVAKYIAQGRQEDLNKFVASWQGHVKWADAHNLLTWMESRHGLACN